MEENNTEPKRQRKTYARVDLIEALCNEFDMDRQTAKLFIETFFEVVIDKLKNGETVKFPRVGKFTVRDKSSRPGRNMITGDSLTIEAKRVVTYRPSVTLQRRLTERLLGEGAPEFLDDEDDE